MNVFGMFTAKRRSMFSVVGYLDSEEKNYIKGGKENEKRFTEKSKRFYAD